jgi:hypothetical protein
VNTADVVFVRVCLLKGDFNQTCNAMQVAGGVNTGDEVFVRVGLLKGDCNNAAM